MCSRRRPPPARGTGSCSTSTRMRRREQARDGRPIFEVAVGLDASGRRLRGVGFPDDANDPDWATPAYFEDFGRIMARGPIPGELFSPLALAHAC